MDNKKGGYAFIIVGGTGAGKTTFIKKALKLVHPEALFLYDVNNEYKEIYNKPLLEFPDFAHRATKVTDAVIVFEEATMFLDNKGSNKFLTSILVRKRHTSNTIFLVFHSLRAVPKYILNLCNFVVLHKTNDPLSIVEQFENDALTEAFKQIKDAKYLTSENGRQYSPHKIVKLIN